MEQFQQLLNKYAELAVRIGVNVQQGQTLVIVAPIGAADFVRAAARKAYEAGAKNVMVDWIDDQITLIKYRQAPDEAFKEFPQWKADGFAQMAENGASFLYVKATDPDLLKGIDPSRIATASKTGAEANKHYLEYTRTNKVSWTIVSVPTPEWAVKIFPGEEKDSAVEKLWEQIFRLTRSTSDDPVAAWRGHLARLGEKQAYLNEKKYRKLRYQAPGTDLTVELPERARWVCAGEATQAGIPFVANIPTEEVFTSPHKDGVNGIVTSTKPLNYGGNLIENFTFTFKDGKVVDVKAESGEDILRDLINTDEGAARLGEVALVPHRSPISESNLIFYNTLFDENASCHLAVGTSFPFCVEGGGALSREELQKLGFNHSLIHVDFMMGSAELDIDGQTADGTWEPVFRKGNWAF